MPIEAFATLVADMRNAQKEYFRTKAAAALERSKRLERLVDEAIGAILAADRQGRLFD
jgi:hypothetical protein